MGWGETEDDNSQQDELNWIQLSVFGSQICNKDFMELKEGKVRNVDNFIDVKKIDEVIPGLFQDNIYCANVFVSIM